MTFKLEFRFPRPQVTKKVWLAMNVTEYVLISADLVTPDLADLLADQCEI